MHKIYLEVITAIRDGNRPSNAGICDNIYILLKGRNADYSLMSYCQDQFCAAAKLWPHYSGRKAFPVPGRPPTKIYWWYSAKKRAQIRLEDRAFAAKQYLDCCDNNRIWDTATYYGRMRMDLLNFVVAQAEQREAGSTQNSVPTSGG